MIDPADPAQLVRFYDEAYSTDSPSAAEYARWRALGAIGKADHVIELCARAGVDPANTLEVGCGDGALLCELRRRGFGGRLSGVEITQAAVAIARGRPEIDAIDLYDGLHLPATDASYDLGILSHVLEHVPDPTALLTEVARACRAVLVEVPLEANLSARRAGKRRHSAEIGHLHHLDRADVRQAVERAALSIVCDLDDPLPLRVHRFFAGTRRARVAATAKWTLRAGIQLLSAPLARRLFTVHHACLCVTSEARSAEAGADRVALAREPAARSAPSPQDARRDDPQL